MPQKIPMILEGENISPQCKKYDVIVIGAGFSGLFAALELAKSGRQILILESDSSILGSKSTSNNECYKLHSGLHYAGDKETAIQCLEHSFAFGSQFPNFILDHKKADAPSRRGQHLIMGNSLVSKEEILEVCDALDKKYRELVGEDGSKAIFGPPDEFIKRYKLDEIQSAEKPPEVGEVVLKIDSGESQIDIDAMRTGLLRRIEEHPNITLKLQHHVNRTSYVSNSLDYQVTAAHYPKSEVPSSESNDIESKTQQSEIPAHQVTFQAPAIVNCTWQAIEEIDSTIGMYVPNEDTLIRAKVSIVVELPDVLQEKNTHIYSIGPYFSFTNIGPKKGEKNGKNRAVITIEHDTNVGSFKPREHRFFGVPEGGRVEESQVEESGQIIDEIFQIDTLELLFNKQRSLEERQKSLAKIGRTIFKNSPAYLSGLEKATLLETRVGFVRMEDTKGGIQLDDPNSAIHRRRSDNSVQLKGLGYLTDAGTKMTYTYKNAVKVQKELLRETKVREELATIIDETIKEEKNKLVEEENKLKKREAEIDLEISETNLERADLERKKVDFKKRFIPYVYEVVRKCYEEEVRAKFTSDSSESKQEAPIGKKATTTIRELITERLNQTNQFHAEIAQKVEEQNSHVKTVGLFATSAPQEATRNGQKVVQISTADQEIYATVNQSGTNQPRNLSVKN